MASSAQCRQPVRRWDIQATAMKTTPKTVNTVSMFRKNLMLCQACMFAPVWKRVRRIGYGMSGFRQQTRRL